MMWRRAAVLAAIAGLALAACDGQESRPTRLPPPTLDPAPSAAKRDDPVATPAENGPKQTMTHNHPVPKAVMSRILDLVAEDSGVARDDILLERAEEATWGDTSLGCPQPNTDYLQRIVQGYWVVLHADNKEYDYRVDQRGRPHRCTGSTRRAPIVYPSDT